MTEDEQARLAILISQVPQREPTTSRYAREIMPEGMTPEEALQQALRNSAPPPRPRCRDPWAAAAAPPLPPEAPTYVPPADWPWQVPPVVDLRDDDDE